MSVHLFIERPGQAPVAVQRFHTPLSIRSDVELVPSISALTRIRSLVEIILWPLAPVRVVVIAVVVAIVVMAVTVAIVVMMGVYLYYDLGLRLNRCNATDDRCNAAEEKKRA